MNIVLTINHTLYSIYIMASSTSNKIIAGITGTSV